MDAHSTGNPLNSINDYDYLKLADCCILVLKLILFKVEDSNSNSRNRSKNDPTSEINNKLNNNNNNNNDMNNNNSNGDQLISAFDTDFGYLNMDNNGYAKKKNFHDSLMMSCDMIKKTRCHILINILNLIYLKKLRNQVI